MSTDSTPEKVSELTSLADLVAAPAAAANATPAAATLPEPPKDITAANPLCTVGRRKAAQARSRMWPGEGKIQVNGKGLDAYFSIDIDRFNAVRPLALVGAAKRYDFRVKVTGGGPSGQANAIALAFARAISIMEPANMRALREAGLLTRDARVKERKKYGRRGARRGFQFSKR